MLIFLEKYNMDEVFVVLMGVIAIVSFCITVMDIFVTKKILRQKIGTTKIVLNGVAYLMEGSCAFAKKAFLNHIVNNGTSVSFDIVIDDSYLTDESNMYIKKR